MEFLISLLLLLASANGLASAFNMDDVAVFLPLLRSVQPRPCPPNELWSTCTANCSDCVRRKSCAVTECQSGCDCLPRYFRVEPGGPCVPVAQCPRPECGANEVFRECGPVCERCGTLLCRLISCDHRCYCKMGHLRNEEGACVPRAECPERSRCSHNEEWSSSGRVDEYCLREEGEEASNRTQDVSGCYCKEGHDRNTFGSCVSSCTFVKCFGGTVYRKCVPKCGTTCRSEADCEEDEEDCHPGCFCPPGLVMNDFNQCIPKQECSTDIREVKIVRGSGIMVEESETTPGGESSTPGHSESSDMDVSSVSSDVSSDVSSEVSSEGVTQTESTAGPQTEATSGQPEDFGNEDI